MEKAVKIKIASIVFLTIFSLTAIFALLYAIYLPAVFKTERIALLMVGVLMINLTLILFFVSILVTNKKNKQIIQYSSLATIIAGAILLVSFLIIFQNSKTINKYVQNKKGLSIENNNFYEKYGYYLYKNRVLLEKYIKPTDEEKSLDDTLSEIKKIDTSKTKYKIKLYEKSPSVTKYGVQAVQNLETLSFIYWEAFKNQVRLVKKEDTLHVIDNEEPLIKNIHKNLLPNVFNFTKEERTISVLVAKEKLNDIKVV